MELELIKELHNRGWFPEFLLRKRYRPLQVTLAVLGFNLVMDSVLASFFGVMTSTTSIVGFIVDYPSWSFEFLLQPTIMGYFCWLQGSATTLFGDLARNDVLPSAVHTRTVLEKGRDLLHNPWASRLTAASALIFTGWFIYQFSQEPPHPGWITAHPAMIMLRAPVYFIITYALFTVIYDLLVIAHTLNSLYKNENISIRIKPFHIDKAGGMGAIGRFSANLGYLIAAIGFTILLSIYFQVSTYIWVLMLVIYFCLAPTVFFSPLFAAHSAMVSYRTNLLRELSIELDVHYKQLHTLRSKDAAQMELLLKKVNQLKELSALTKEFPVWPFNLRNLKKYFGLILTPSLPGVISIISELLSRLFSR